MTKDFKATKLGQSIPTLSPSEWKEKKQAEKDGVYKMIDDTVLSIIQTPSAFKTFLDTQSRLDRYSVANTLLIYNQYPSARQLKDFNDWASEKISLKKGAKSISILEPVEFTRSDGTAGVSYNVKKLFDVSQTNSKQKTAPTLNREPNVLIASLIDTSPVEVEVTNSIPHPNTNGAFYSNDNQCLYIAQDIENSTTLCQRIATELAHAQLSINSNVYSRSELGFHASCIAYMFCQKYGVDTDAFGIENLPDNWKGKSAKQLRAELTKIRTSMHEICSRVSEDLYRKKQARSKESER